MQIFLQFVFTYAAVQNQALVDLVNEKKPMLGASVAFYLLTTVFLVADIDMRYQRIFPLNYLLWLVQSISITYITCFVAIK